MALAHWLLGLAALLLTPVLALYVYGLRPIWRWKMRHIPGPTPQWLFGHIMFSLHQGTHYFHQENAKKYGPIYKTIGISGIEVVVSSPKLVREVLTANFNRSEFPAVICNRETWEYDISHLLTSRDDHARAIRAAWSPFFYSTSLASFAPVINNSARALCNRLELAANEGSLIDVRPIIHAFTLDTIGRVAFGVDLGSQAAQNTEHTADEADRASQLRQDVGVVADSFGGTISSWFVLFATFPELVSTWRYLAQRYPDAPLRRLIASQTRLIKVASELVRQHRAKVNAERAEQADSDPFNPATPTGATLGLQTKLSSKSSMSNGNHSPGSFRAQPSGLKGQYSFGSEPGTPGTPKTPRKGVQPGSFVDLLVRNNRSTGRPWPDLQVVGQSVAMILAGYETTGSLLNFAVYCLARSPDKARMLELEVDKHTGDTTLDSVDTLVYADACLRETLRLFPGAATGNREAQQDCILGGYYIPKGTALRCALYAMHHNGELWKDPEEYIPERWLEGTKESNEKPAHAWQGFGEGQRACPGSRLALEEAKTALVHIFRQFRFRLGPGQDPLAVRHIMTLTPAKGIWVTVHKRV